MDREAWRATVPGVAQSRTRLKRLSTRAQKQAHCSAQRAGPWREGRSLHLRSLRSLGTHGVGTPVVSCKASELCVVDLGGPVKVSGRERKCGLEASLP